ncbi:winged helix-turn-helix domain-containing protein [Vibrio mediterranei]|uniref:winged helix-turn-helix domain-containing protein n=1 Tax=Vibrio mediterranei TaxID=689 RepID=UPI0038D14BB6
MTNIYDFETSLFFINRKDPPVTLMMKSSGNCFTISTAESHILQKLSEDSGVVSKEDLIAVGWSNPEAIGENSLPVAVSNLRKVLRNEGVDIINLPRQGYKIEYPSLSNIKNIPTDEESPSQSLTVATTGIFPKAIKKAILVSYILFILMILHITFTLIEGWVIVDCIDSTPVKECHFDGSKYEIL